MRMLAILSVITGLIYPLVMTGVAQIFFSDKANGSLIRLNGRIVGSELVGQSFTSDRYFWPRPSAVSYNPVPSAGTNLGPISGELRDSLEARASRFGASVAAVPSDLLEASGSGLDPHISPEAARYQVDKIIKMRNLDLKTKTSLFNMIDKYIEFPTLGLLGEPRVNVLKLNIALDSLAGVLK